MAFYRIDRNSGNGPATEGFYDDATDIEIRVWNPDARGIHVGTHMGFGAAVRGEYDGYTAKPVIISSILENVIAKHITSSEAPKTGILREKADAESTLH